MSLSYVIWGFGNNGKNLIDVLGKQKVCAIIDRKNSEIERQYYKRIPLITYEQYKKKFNQYPIIVTPMKYDEIKNILMRDKNTSFYILNESKIDIIAFLSLRDDKFIDIFNIQINKKIYVCGDDLFSVELVDYLKKHKKIVETVESNMNVQLLEKEILIDTENKRNEDKKIDYLTINEGVKQKYENKLSVFKNIHKNKRMFIIATGPSLKIRDLEKLKQKNELSMSMNGIYHIFSKTTWRPNYYVVSDGEAVREYVGLDKKKFKGIISFVADSCVDCWSNLENNQEYGFFVKQDYKNIKFSNDFSCCAYSGKTVVYICLQLAAYMGIKEIYLLGCDFNFSKNFNSPNDHFYGSIKKNYTFDYEFVKCAYEQAKIYSDKCGIKIFNATRGGKLEVFERVDLDEVLATEI